jgi:SecD/SecF fusion protein
MQLKGLVKIFTAALILFSLWRLSFTFIAHGVEDKMNAQAERMVATAAPNATGTDKEALLDAAYIKLADSMRGETVFNFLGAKYTYQEIKEKELQLGLDLQGGMSVTLEVGIDELVKSMSNNPENPALKKAIEEAEKRRGNTDADFVTIFGQVFTQQNPGMSLAQLFTKPSQTAIKLSSTNEEVLKVIRAEADGATERTYNVLRARIDKFGVAQPSINLNKDKGIITVELAGVRDPESVRRNLQASAKLEFWRVRTNQEIIPYLVKANTVVENYLKGASATEKSETSNAATDSNAVASTNIDSTASGSLSSLLGNDSGKEVAVNDTNAANANLFTYLQPAINQQGQALDIAIIGTVEKKHAEKVMELLRMDIVKAQFPANIKFLYGEIPGSNADKNDPKVPYGVYAIETQPGTTHAPLEGDKVTKARFNFTQDGKAEISLEMNQEGALIWSNLTGSNIGRPIAIALDDYVYSAPNVNQKISGGHSSITGNFTPKTGTELANILETGKLDAPARIVQEQIVGPTLGQESISGGIKSFALSFLIIFILMVVYYNTGGIVANLALILNLLFTFGVLANLGATLTMPGIAGLVLGIGMAVDVNVIIFERIKEELAAGKTYAQAVADGYRRSYAPVLDSHITGLITAVVLYIFGMGPILGFATTQILALLLSLFSGILISRLITDIYMRRGRHFNYFTKFSSSIFKKAHFKFIEIRKVTYTISAIMVLGGVIALFNGFDYGVEFDGGRSYTIKFDQPLQTNVVREKLEKHLGKFPVVKTIGTANQLNITTDYLIEKPGREVDNEVISKLYEGLKAEKFIPESVDLATFSSNKYIQKQDKVLPTISDDLKRGAIWATVISIIAIFIYIFARFRKWQYSVGTIISLVHDTAVMLILFSFFKSIVPFSLEIDQHFIAALLTVIGFSMNDTVIVFDRIREYFRKSPNADKKEVINSAINDTLSRTIMTSATLFITVLILFIFGGEALRGFSFAMLIGIVAGTYSSIFVAAPILVDMDKNDSLRQEEDKEERIRLLKEQA